MSLCKLLHAIGRQRLGAVRSMETKELEFLTFLLVVAAEEPFDFFQHFSIQILGQSNVTIVLRFNRDGEQSIISPACPALVRLHRFNHADQSRRDQASGKSWLIHKEQYVQRVSIFSDGRWQEPKIKWEDHSFRKNFRKLKAGKIINIFVLVVTSFWRFNNDVPLLFVVVVCRNCVEIHLRSVQLRKAQIIFEKEAGLESAKLGYNADPRQIAQSEFQTNSSFLPMLIGG